MCEMYFDAGAEIPQIMRAIHNPEERLKWDRDIEKGETISIVNGKIMLWHQKNKSPISFISKRDFLEKKMKFSKDNRHFIVFTSIPDEMQPAENNIVRATTILGYHCFEKLDDGRIKFTGVMQNDFCLGSGLTGKAA